MKGSVLHWTAWEDSEVEQEHRILGMGFSRNNSPSIGQTASTLTDVLAIQR